MMSRQIILNHNFKLICTCVLAFVIGILDVSPIFYAVNVYRRLKKVENQYRKLVETFHNVSECKTVVYFS
jgi:hypothetical protein